MKVNRRLTFTYANFTINYSSLSETCSRAILMNFHFPDFLFFPFFLKFSFVRFLFFYLFLSYFYFLLLFIYYNALSGFD